MVQIPGTLSIKKITGRYGDFNVATLDCTLGKFSIRDAMLDEYNEGTYQGTFGVNRIFSGSYQASNRFVIETRAELGAIWLDDYQEGEIPPSEPLEADPLAEERKAQEALKAKHLESNIDRQPMVSNDDQQLSELFGELWPLGSKVGDIVKLNPEVGREKMGHQLTYLKRRIGDKRVWKFEPIAQHWIRLRADKEV
ncbi:hypothetical protein MACH09_46040 [Vibrio sp. MACH09]|uniref:DUF3275 family protein n=1 Tax=Vibrio sp. MACH09 TaxID=3025122 RepID=UPI002792A387|nr:DUF3275 family protein [Vibrio sp. MACH09]GLO64096.1 hypothetical protein MACH09_46040 [Vibrio sp. MACH09]